MFSQQFRKVSIRILDKASIFKPRIIARLESDSSSSKDISEMIKALPKRYKRFDDGDAKMIPDDIDVMLNEKQERLGKLEMLRIKPNLKRGQRGVFDLDELVQLVREEKMNDIAVIKVPDSLKYCDYMVICTANSNRHLRAFLEILNSLYKAKKGPADPYLDLRDQSPDWRLIDLGNLILHLFRHQTREEYDLETLWTVGEKFDDQIQRPRRSEDTVRKILEQHFATATDQHQQANNNG